MDAAARPAPPPGFALPGFAPPGFALPGLAPLGPGFAAEIRGLDLGSLDEAGFGAIRAAFLRHPILVFCDQTFSEDAHVAFSRRLGELQVHVLNQYHNRRNPAVIHLSNIGQDGKPIGEHPDPGSAIWHTDGSWSARRPLATTLYGMELPREGGDTLFADMEGAWEALPEALKARIEGRIAIHDLDYSRRRTNARAQMTEEQRRAAPPVGHAMVRICPETGRRAIYLGEHASHVLGMPVEEGRALIAEVNAFATQPRFVYRHRWSLHDLLLWDNRRVLHSATDFDWINDRRTMRRTTVLGDALPLAAA